MSDEITFTKEKHVLTNGDPTWKRKKIVRLWSIFVRRWRVLIIPSTWLYEGCINIPVKCFISEWHFARILTTD